MNINEVLLFHVFNILLSIDDCERHGQSYETYGWPTEAEHDI